VRCWRLRKSIDVNVLRGFGIASAIGGTAGAFALFRFESEAKLILAVLLIATGLAGLTGWNTRAKPASGLSVGLGALSGLFGGLAGNQGGLRAAALTTYRLSPAQFVATSAAVGLMVDAARLPVYIARGSARLLELGLPIAIATAGVLVGTIVGERILMRLSRRRFTQIVSALILALGAWLLYQTT